VNICQGQLLSFTANPVNGGVNPDWQWLLNGNLAGTNSAVFSSSGFVNGDIVSVIMTSSYACPANSTATSGSQTVNVGTLLTPSVTISATPAGTICQGQLLTLTAQPVNGGVNPQYTWFVNGIQVFAGADTYAANNLQTGDQVTVILNSDAPCATPAQATSAAYAVQTTNGTSVSVNISANPSTSVCPGDTVTLWANGINAGQNPSWQWYVNGTPAGITTQTYTFNPQNGDAVSVQLIPDTLCPQPALPVSSLWIAQVSLPLTPSVSIVQNPSGTVCEGSLLTFTLTELNQGNTPQYNWTVNGISVAQGSTYNSSNLQNGDILGVVMNSSAPCATPLSAQDNLTISTIPVVTPSVTITSNPIGPYCDGVPVTFTANPVNGGPIPGYQWFVNQTGTISAADTFTVFNLSNGDQVSVQMFSSAPCAMPVTVTSPLIMIQIAPPLGVLLVGDTLICRGEKVDLLAEATGGDGNYDYTWTNSGTALSTQTIYPFTSTAIGVSVSDGCGSAAATDALNLTVIPGITAGYSYTPGSPDIFNNNVTLEDQSVPVAQSGFWQFGILGNYSGLATQIVFPGAGTYPFTYTVMDAYGCADSVYGEIWIRDVQACYVPEAFTPNGDDLNEVFEPSLTNYDGYEMDIFGVWGQSVYYTGDSKPWDGTDKSGKPVPQGVYVYRIRLYAEGSEDKILTGRVSVIR
jgi:gliding motility-associated-like protein